MVKGVLLPPRSTTTVHVTYNTSLSINGARNVRVAQPDYSGADGLLLPSAYFKPHLAPSITCPAARIICDVPTYPLYITNYTDSYHSLLPQQAIGSVRACLTAPPTVADAEEHPAVPHIISAFTTSADGTITIDPAACNISDKLTREQREQLLALLQQHAGTFVRKSVDGPPQAHGVTFAIHTDDSLPIKQVPYRQSPQKAAFIEREVAQLLSKGLVQPSFSV